jgi:hypothetical protein
LERLQRLTDLSSITGVWIGRMPGRSDDNSSRESEVVRRGKEEETDRMDSKKIRNASGLHRLMLKHRGRAGGEEGFARSVATKIPKR